MKKTRILLSVLLAIIIALVSCGCSPLIKAVIFQGKVEEAEATPKIAFGKTELSEESNEVIMTPEEFSEKDIVYDKYRSDYHYSQLSEEEKLFYNMFEYALENSYIYIYVDDLISNDAGQLIKSLKFLALDSPLLAQNLLYETGTFTTYYEVVSGVKACLDGNYILVKNFADDIWQTKLQAVKKAEEIVGKMPSGMSELERARYLHDYTVSNVKYRDYGQANEPMLESINPYLYDGLVKGSTHCDGSANMYSLLLNMSNVECMEKMYSGEDTVGHTWNVAKIDGVWQNVDATASAEEVEDTELQKKRFFAFDDRLQKYTPDYSEIYPKVTEGKGFKVNTALSKLERGTFVKTVRAAFSENKEKYAALLVDEYTEKEAERCMQRLADSLNKKVYWYDFEVINGKTLMLVIG